jgi:hypothetical protein
MFASKSARVPCMPNRLRHCRLIAAVLSSTLLLLMKFVEGRTVAVRPFRVLGATLPTAAVNMTDHAAWSTRARMLSVFTRVRRPILIV